MRFSTTHLLMLILIGLNASPTVADTYNQTTDESLPPYRVSSEQASLARDQIRAGHHLRFLTQQQESKLINPPNSFAFDYAPINTQGQITQIFWNEPEALFATINLGRSNNIHPGNLLQYYKGASDIGGAMVVLQTFENNSYTMILQAHLVPAVNDQVR